jgi:hypothetical protein
VGVRQTPAALPADGPFDFAGYTGVQHAEDVHGLKGDFILAAVYLYIGGRIFGKS